MGVGRTILAVVVAVSVAWLPAASGASVQLKSTDMTDMSVSEAMDDCCPHANPCDQAMADCGSMAACMVNCLSYAGGMSSPLVYPVQLAALMPLFESADLPSHTGSPPFRPPRV